MQAAAQAGSEAAEAEARSLREALNAAVAGEREAASAMCQVEKELRTVRVQAHHFQKLFLFGTRKGRRGGALPGTG